MAAQDWRFTQLTGDRESLTLTGWSAPFGRPRKGAVVVDELRLRDSETYYAGNPFPTRHIFGTRQEPWTLKGRWMDTVLGLGGAKEKADDWKKFVNASQPVRVQWGSLLSFRGLITGLKTTYEGTSDFEWELTIKIDSDDDLKTTRKLNGTLRQPKDIAQEVSDNLFDTAAGFPVPSATKFKPSEVLGAMREDFIESLDGFVSSVNGPSAELLRVADEVRSFDQATSGELKRLRGGSSQIRTAYLELSDTVEANGSGDILFTRTADGDIAYASFAANSSILGDQTLALLSDMDRQAEIAERGSVQTTIVAQTNASWESLSSEAYGSADGADKIRQANGAKFGEKPVTGRSYVIPKNG